MPVTQEMENTLANLKVDSQKADLHRPKVRKMPTLAPGQTLAQWKQENSTPEWNRKAKQIRAKRKLQRKNRKQGRRK